MTVRSYFERHGQLPIPDEVYKGIQKLTREEYKDENPKQALVELHDLLRAPPVLITSVVVAFDKRNRVVAKCFIEEVEKNVWTVGYAFVTASERGKKHFSEIRKEIDIQAGQRSIRALDAAPASTAPWYWTIALKRWGFAEPTRKNDLWRKTYSKERA
jgi:hypothetical protein